jgi:hypothetical protein
MRPDRLPRTPLFAVCVALAACQGGEVAAPAAPVVTAIDVPAATGSGSPFLGGQDRPVVLSWLEPDGSGAALRYTTFGPSGWSAPTTVTSGADLMVNWADVPSVVPLTPTIWGAHWLATVPDSRGAYDVAAAVSQDGGATWSTPQTLNDDGTATEHGFATLFGWDDAVGVVWLDGRQLAAWSFDDPDALLGTELRFARLGADGAVLERGVIDTLVCDCCQTDVAVASEGPIVVYRDRTEDEVRDVVVRRYAGSAWSAPRALGAENWQIEGCPVNGPSIDARGAHTAVAWFTAADDRPRVRFAQSLDGGVTFSSALDIDVERAFGQVAVAVLDDNATAVAWWRGAPDGQTALAVRIVGRDGALGPILTVALEATPQPLDVPEMLAVDAGLLLAWTGVEHDGIHSALVRNAR